MQAHASGADPIPVKGQRKTRRYAGRPPAPAGAEPTGSGSLGDTVLIDRRTHIYSVSEFRTAITAHPELSLSSFNESPSLSLAKLPYFILRTAADGPTEGGIIPVEECTMPFTSTQNLTSMVLVLGVIKIFDRLTKLMSVRNTRVQGYKSLPFECPLSCVGTPCRTSAHLEPRQPLSSCP